MIIVQKATRPVYRESIARHRRHWQLVGRTRLVHPRPHRLPWATPFRAAALPEPAGRVDLPLPPWPGSPRRLWLEEHLLPALVASGRRIEVR